MCVYVYVHGPDDYNVLDSLSTAAHKVCVYVYICICACEITICTDLNTAAHTICVYVYMYVCIHKVCVYVCMYVYTRHASIYYTWYASMYASVDHAQSHLCKCIYICICMLP
jgi:hypothetical protein